MFLLTWRDEKNINPALNGNLFMDQGCICLVRYAAKNKNVILRELK